MRRTRPRRSGFRCGACCEIPNGVDFDRAAGSASPAIAGVDRGSPYVLFLGRINWKKGLDRLIEAMAHAPGVRLIVAGNDEEGYQPALELDRGSATA